MPQIYPQSRIATIDASLVAVAWALLLLMLVVLLAAMLKISGSIEILLGLAGGFLVFGLAHLMLCFFHKCPHCEKHPTLQGFEPPHQNSLNQSKFSGWAGAVINILRRRRLVCIHCGSKFVIEP